MSGIGKDAVSFKKQVNQTSGQVVTGFQKLMFAHKSPGGETTVNLNALVTPPEMTANGFTQPSSAQIAAAQLLFFKKNIVLFSSIRGILDPFLTFSVTSSTSISLAYSTLPNEIIIGTIDPVATSGTRVVDASPVVVTGTLAATTTDINIGTPLTTNKYPSAQQGAALVFVNGQQLFRNTGNSSTTLDGNYYEVDNGSGMFQVIRLNVADPDNAKPYLVVSNGLLAERPDGTQMATIEYLNGQINSMAAIVSALSGLSQAAILGSAATNSDLTTFGNRVLALEGNRARIDQSNAWTAYQNLPGRTDGSAVPSGVIGQIIQGTALSPAAVSGSFVQLGSIPLPLGIFILVGSGANFLNGTITTPAYGILALSPSPTAASGVINQSAYGQPSVSGQYGGTTVTGTVTVTTAATYYLSGLAQYGSASGGSGFGFTSLYAIRIG